MEKSSKARPSSGSPPQSPWSTILGLICVLFSLQQINTWYYKPKEYIVCSSVKGIYTVDESQPTVECLRIVGDLIHSTTSIAEVEAASEPWNYAGSWRVWHWMIAQPPKVHYIDNSSIIVPGLADAHAHVLEYGFKMQLQLDGAQSVQEVINRVKHFIVSHPDLSNDTWIEGMGWDQTRWLAGEAKFPTADDFDVDPMLVNRPIALTRVDGHATWVSNRVLELMGELPSQVEGGLIVRDKKGKATGVFVDNAMLLIPRPAWTEERMKEWYATTMQDALKHGLTSIHDADTSLDGIEFYRKQAKAGALPIRLYLMAHVDSDEYWGGQITQFFNYGKHSRLTLRSVKLFTDGALGSYGAALLKPYADNSATSGIMRSTPAALKNLIERFYKDGWQVNVHCIGDRANHVVLGAFEDVIKTNKGNVTQWRPRIEHAQIMTKIDLDKIGKLGVIASVQPTHATSDMSYAESRLGRERIKGAYAYQTLLQASPVGILPLGSDFPVEGINPLSGFYAAVTRLWPDGTSPHGPGGWFASQRLTRTQALKGMTLDAAYASFAETERGSLTAGKKADFVILDRNIMTVLASDILGTKVLATVVDGRVAYRDADSLLLTE